MKGSLFLLYIYSCLLVNFVVSDPVKFAYIYDGPVGDAGYTFSHNQARIELEKNNVNDITTTFYHTIDYGQQSIDLMDDLASKNFSIIAFSSNGFLASIEVAAKKYPSIFFIICDEALPTQPNVGIVQPAIYEGEYMAGIIAGIATKTNNIGLIANVLDTWSGKNINAFAIGARKVNPNINIYVDFINTWYDENLENSVTSRLINRNNVDVVTQHTDSFIPMITAKTANKYGIGWAIDVRPLVGPEVLSSVLLNFVVGLQYEFDLYMSGQWLNTSLTRVHWGIKEDLIQLAPFSSLFNKTSSSYAIYEQETEKFKTDSVSIFCGDYATQLNVNGTQLEGGCLSYNQIETMKTLLPFVKDVTSDRDDTTNVPVEEEDSSSSAVIYSSSLIMLALVHNML